MKKQKNLDRALKFILNQCNFKAFINLINEYNANLLKPHFVCIVNSPESIRKFDCLVKRNLVNIELLTAIAEGTDESLFQHCLYKIKYKDDNEKDCCLPGWREIIAKTLSAGNRDRIKLICDSIRLPADMEIQLLKDTRDNKIPFSVLGIYLSNFGLHSSAVEFLSAFDYPEAWQAYRMQWPVSKKLIWRHFKFNLKKLFGKF